MHVSEQRSESVGLMIECCVCSVDVDPVGKTHCRKIHGSSCEAQKQHLNSLVLECCGIGLNHFTEIREGMQQS